VVVLASTGSEEPRTPGDDRAPATDVPRLERGNRRPLHEVRTATDEISLRHASFPELARTVVACVAVSGDDAADGADGSGSLARQLVSYVRQNDRICMIGGGRVVIVFHGVDPSLHAHVLGARLARSAAQSLSSGNRHATRITVGIADGLPGTDVVTLTSAAIDSAEHTESESPEARHENGLPRGASPVDLVVHATLTTSNGHTQRAAGTVRKTVSRITRDAHRNSHLRPVSSVAMPQGVLVVDSAPPIPGVAGPAATAVTSLVQNAGIGVAGTFAPSFVPGRGAAVLPGHVPQDAIALLVVHPVYGSDTEEEHSEGLERPGALTQALCKTGFRVLAVGVGASDIVLAECVLQGAENAFAIGELPDELSNALSQPDFETCRTEAAPQPPDAIGQRSDRLGKLLLLTRSERRVLHHLTTGATAIEIAEELVLSLATVRSHIRSILRKLEVSSQLAAVAIAQGHPARNADPESERTIKVSSPAAAL